jgi:radical SAM-linked protein
MPTVTQPLPSNTEPRATPQNQPAVEQPLRIRYRVRFAKTDLLRWISHRDLARLWERLIRRAALKPSMTEGFHPKPRIGFPSALALGVESLDEVVEIELAEQLTPAEMLQRLQQDDQPGLTIKSVARLPEKFGKAQLLQSDYLITVIDAADYQAIAQAIEQLMSQQTVSLQRKNKTMTVQVAEQILKLELLGQQLHLSLAASESASLRPADVLDLLGFSDWIEKGSLITRVRVALQREFQSDHQSDIAFAAKATNPDAESESITEESDSTTQPESSPQQNNSRRDQPRSS